MIATDTPIYPTILPKQAQLLWQHGFFKGYPPPQGIPVNESLFGGAAGGGKSQGLRILATTMAHDWPLSHFAIIRRAGPDLKKTQIDPFLTEIPNTNGWNARDSEYTWPNGSKTQFFSCFEDMDYLRFKSYEFAGVGIDEATEFSEDALRFIKSRVRWSSQPAWYPVIVYASNPGGIGHLYLKGNFVDPGMMNGYETFWGPDLELPNGKVVRSRRSFIRSMMEDNTTLTYEQAMAGTIDIGDPELRRAMAEGDWELNLGQAFSDFRRAKHVVSPFVVPGDWPRWRAVDWGYDAPAACLWLARNPESRQTFVYREWVQRGVPTQMQAINIRNLSHGDSPIRLTLADPSMWRKTKGVGPSEADEYLAGGVPLTRANNNRHMGWQRIHKALADFPEYGPGLPTRPPELQIFDTCPVLINALANIERDPHDQEDIKEPTNATDPVRDDVLDALRYGEMGAAVASRKASGARKFVVGRR